MITLVVAFCTTVALTDCKTDKRILLPASTTMQGCLGIRQLMMDDQIGELIIPGQYKKVFCEPSY